MPAGAVGGGASGKLPPAAEREGAAGAGLAGAPGGPRRPPNRCGTAAVKYAPARPGSPARGKGSKCSTGRETGGSRLACQQQTHVAEVDKQGGEQLTGDGGRDPAVPPGPSRHLRLVYLRRSFPVASRAEQAPSADGRFIDVCTCVLLPHPRLVAVLVAFATRGGRPTVAAPAAVPGGGAVPCCLALCVLLKRKGG